MWKGEISNLPGRQLFDRREETKPEPLLGESQGDHSSHKPVLGSCTAVFPDLSILWLQSGTACSVRMGRDTERKEWTGDKSESQNDIKKMHWFCPYTTFSAIHVDIYLHSCSLIYLHKIPQITLCNCWSLMDSWNWWAVAKKNNSYVKKLKCVAVHGQCNILAPTELKTLHCKQASYRQRRRQRQDEFCFSLWLFLIR